MNWITPKEMGKLASREITSTERKITEKGIKNSSAKLLPINSVILSSRAPIGHLAINKSLMATNQGCKGLVPSEKLNYEYLYYFLSHSKQLLNDMGSGATFKELSGSKLATVEIPLPPLSTQQRIVAKLDAIFAEIDKATAAAESNAKNAEALFQSYLSNIEAPQSTLGEHVTIKTGKLDSNASVENGMYPFFTCSKEIFSINDYAFDCEAVLLAGNNASGDFNVKHYKGKFNAYQRTYVITIDGRDRLTYRYLYFQLVNALKRLKNMSVGANTKFLKIGMIRDLKFPLPEMNEQLKILENLRVIEANTALLRNGYLKRVEISNKLKQVILKQAFAGELVKE